MPIIRSTDIIRGVNIIPVGDIRLNDNCDDDIRLDDIRMLAEQVLCCTEDMQCAEGDDDSALILPIRLLPKSVRTLNNSFHKKMVRVTWIQDCPSLTRSKGKLHAEMGFRKGISH